MKTPQVIAEWDGVGALASGVEREGFLLPRRFGEFTAPVVGLPEERWREELLRYACLFVRHAGTSTDEAVRTRLALARRELVMNLELRSRYSALHKRWVEAELRPDPRLEEGWSERRVHLREVAQRVASMEGFETTKKGYVIAFARDLRLEVEVDVGRPGSRVPQVVMDNHLRATRGSWSMPLPWDEILPGMLGYAMCSEPRTLLWAIKAHVTVGKVFASTFA